MPTHEHPPLVLIIAGHDPSGAAGIQADIETVTACGAGCASLLTATTTQDTTRFLGMHPQRAEDFAAQGNLLLQDMHFSGCKIGLLGSVGIAEATGDLIPRLGPVPVVLDPILRSGTGTPVADEALVHVIRTRLLPHCSVITPNRAEARVLAGCDDDLAAAQRLLALGARNVLVTGADEAGPTVINILYRRDGPVARFEFPRLPGQFHGSGCTLSAGLAAFLARGFDPGEAARLAQEYTWSALSTGIQRGRGQQHPNRIRIG